MPISVPPIMHRQRELRGLTAVAENLKVVSGNGGYFSSLLSEARIPERADHGRGYVLFRIHGILQSGGFITDSIIWTCKAVSEAIHLCILLWLH